jgi:hypothetical protein
MMHSIFERPKHTDSPPRVYRLPALIGSLLVLIAAGPARAQTNTWLGGDSRWSNATKWKVGVVPNGSTPIVIPNGTVRDDVNVLLSSTLTNSGGLVTGKAIVLTISGTSSNEGGFTNAGLLSVTENGALVNFNDARMSNGGTLVAAGFLINLGTLNNF